MLKLVVEVKEGMSPLKQTLLLKTKPKILFTILVSNKVSVLDICKETATKTNL